MNRSDNGERGKHRVEPLRRVTTEPDIFVVARHKTERVKSEILSDFRRMRAGHSDLDPTEIRRFERRWLRGYRDVENRVFALGLSPDARACMEQLRPILAEVYELVQDCAAALVRDAGEEPTAQEPVEV